jgi:hypothetical protein
VVRKVFKIKYFLVVITLLIAISGCNKDECPDKDPEYHYLTDTFTNRTPYTGKETLTYLYTTPSDTDTVVFKGQGRETWFYEDYDGSVCGPKDIYENERFIFNSKETDNKLMISNIQYDEKYSFDDIVIMIDSMQTKLPSSSLHKNSFRPNIPHKFYKENTILDIKYKKVFLFNLDRRAYSVFYNKKFGLLQINKIKDDC